jgi:hypothetical protein
MEGGGRPPKRRKVETDMNNLQIESCLKGYPATVCCTDELPAHVGSMSPFEVVQAIQSASVGVVGLDSRRTVVVFRSVDD